MLIGEFEAAVKAADPNREPDTFKLCGETFEVADEPNIVALGMFARSAREGADTGDMESLATLIDTIASVVVPEDENRFLSLASRNRLDAELLLKIVAAVMESQAGRPTAPSVDSSTGRSATSASWRAPSSSEAPSAPKTWRDTPFAQRELAANPERFADIKSITEHAAALAAAPAS